MPKSLSRHELEATYSSELPDLVTPVYMFQDLLV